MSNTTTVLLIAGSAVVTIGVGYYIYHKRHEIERAATENSPAKPFAAKTSANTCDDFKKNASAFNGIYEPLRMVSAGNVRGAQNVFSDFSVRIKHLNNSPALQAYWEEEFSGFENWTDDDNIRQAKKLMSVLKEFGLKHSEETEITVDDETSKYYYTDDGGIIMSGSLAKVNFPFWTVDERVIEKGELAKIKTEEDGSDVG